MSDLISRQTAIKEIRKCRFVVDGIEKLKALPSAEPERKKGRWNTYYHGGTDFSYSCAWCGYGAPFDMKGGKVFQKKWNFCPNCGADMRGEQNDSV